MSEVETETAGMASALSATVPLLQARRIRKEFVLGPERLTVLNGVDLTVMPGEMVAVEGPSGSGKSTLVHILAGLDRPTDGDVCFAGTSLAACADDFLARFRNRNIGLIFQFHHLLPEFTVLENVMLPWLIAGESPSVARQRAERALEEIGFTIRMRHYPAQLSGGEKQKVATARAIVTSPLILLADEPTGNLDTHSAQNLLHLFCELNSRSRVTMLIVTHNPRVAQLCTRRLFLSGGVLRENEGN